MRGGGDGDGGGGDPGGKGGKGEGDASGEGEGEGDASGDVHGPVHASGEGNDEGSGSESERRLGTYPGTNRLRRSSIATACATGRFTAGRLHGSARAPTNMAGHIHSM